MAARLWRLTDIPASYRTNGVLLDPKAAQVSGANITAIPDGFGVRPFAQPVASLQPSLGLVNGFPAIVHPNAPNNLHLVPASAFAPAWWLIVAQFQDGLAASWPPTAYINLLSDGGSNSLTRVAADASGANLIASGWTGAASKNGGAYGPALLPLPMSLVALRGNPTMAQWSPGRGDRDTTRGWRGPIFFALALGLEPSDELLRKIEGRVAWDFGLQASLPAGHPYRNHQPLQGTPDAWDVRARMPRLHGRQDGTTLKPSAARAQFAPLRARSEARIVHPVAVQARAEAAVLADLRRVREARTAAALPPLTLRVLAEPRPFIPRGRVVWAEKGQTVRMSRGDTSPGLGRRLLDEDGAPLALEGARVVFSMALALGGDVLIHRRPCEVDAEAGTAVYYWRDGDTDRRGVHRGEFEVTFEDGAVETSPRGGAVVINIVEDIA